MSAELRKKIELKLNNSDELPTLPVIASRIMALTNNPSSSASDITEIISLDQSMTIKLLKLVNSSFYGFPGEISTIEHAVVILGFNEVKNLSIATSVFNAFSNKGSALKKEGLWRHAAVCAAVSRMIAKELGEKECGMFFVSGLLHDIGRVFLASYMPEALEAVIKKASKSLLPVNIVEEEVHGINHSAIGGILSERWKLPAEITEAIRCHHDPGIARINHTLTAIVSLANSLCHMEGLGSLPGVKPTLVSGGLEILKRGNHDLNLNHIEKIVSKLKTEISGIDSFLSIIS